MVSPYQTGWKWTRTAKPTYTMQQEIFKKMLRKTSKSRILITMPDTTSGNGVSSIELARLDGVVTFTSFSQLTTAVVCGLSSAESLSCPKSIGSIGGTPIFWGQQYSSCSKAGGCWAAQLLGDFRRNLLIVSWATPTPGCTANFPGN